MAEATARALVLARFGAPVNPVINKSTSSIGVTSSRLMINDPDRLGFLVVNLSVNDLYIMTDPLVSASRGIKAGPNGGSVSVVWFEDFEICAWEWFAIASGAASAVLVVEYLSGR
jgi:hypothetical protein